MKVWIVMAADDDGSDEGYRYVSSVWSDEDKAKACAENMWGGEVTDAFEVQG